MKKKLTVFVLGAMGLMLIACGSQDTEAEVSEAATQAVEEAATEDTLVEDIATEDPEEEVFEEDGMSTPWVDSDEAGVLEATGFDIVAPEDAANVAYSYIPSEGLVQMNYTTGNAMWIYRVQPTDALEDISGVYCEWNNTEEITVAGMEAIEYSYTSEPEGEYIDDVESTRVLNWYDAQNKVTYSLTVIGTDLNGMDTAVYAEKLYALTTVGSETDAQ